MNTNIKALAQDLSNYDNLLLTSNIGEIMLNHLPNILDDKNLLDKSQFNYEENNPYTKHIVYSCDNWSLQALIWKPKASTPIHNHKCWCTVGIYQGEVFEERFKSLNNNTVQCYKTFKHKKGVFATLTPDGNDIHRLINNSNEIAITLHFYGINAFKQPSSILNEFSDIKKTG